MMKEIKSAVSGAAGTSEPHKKHKKTEQVEIARRTADGGAYTADNQQPAESHSATKVSANENKRR